MREFSIGKNDAGQRLDRFLSKNMPLLPGPLLQKYIRIKRIKCNGARCQRDQRLVAGDVLQVYVNDEFFEQPREDNLFLTLSSPIWIFCMRTRISSWRTSVPDWWSTRMRRRK